MVMEMSVVAVRNPPEETRQALKVRMALYGQSTEPKI